LRDDPGFKTTAARLLWYGVRTLMASIETARHGFRRPYGVLARSVIETIATVVFITMNKDALDEFHAGTLQSSKCIGPAKAVFPPLGQFYGMLSNQFVHIGTQHAADISLLPYFNEDEALPFILSTLRANTWMLYVAAELVFHDELPLPRYWFALGGGQVAYNPSETERAWMARFLDPAE
jgi:hypothetical protein